MLNSCPLLAGLCAVSVLAPGSTALAHDFWIEPETFRPAVGQPVPIVLRVGEHFTGTSQPYVPEWFSDYVAAGPSGAQPVAGEIGDDPAGRFTPDAPGSWVIGYRSRQSFVQLGPGQFERYLEKQGLEWVIAARKKRGESEELGRELFSRCAKSVVRAGNGTRAEGFDAALGFTLELVPERDPNALASGDELPVRLLYEGRPLEGALVVAFSAENPDVKQRLRTDADGRAALVLPDRGTWLVTSVHMIELTEAEAGADWESFWASLTFELEGS